jgi:hypothetical protein
MFVLALVNVFAPLREGGASLQAAGSGIEIVPWCSIFFTFTQPYTNLTTSIFSIGL